MIEWTRQGNDRTKKNFSQLVRSLWWWLKLGCHQVQCERIAPSLDGSGFYLVRTGTWHHLCFYEHDVLQANLLQILLPGAHQHLGPPLLLKARCSSSHPTTDSSTASCTLCSLPKSHFSTPWPIIEGRCMCRRNKTRAAHYKHWYELSTCTPVL